MTNETTFQKYVEKLKQEEEQYHVAHGCEDRHYEFMWQSMVCDAKRHHLDTDEGVRAYVLDRIRKDKTSSTTIRQMSYKLDRFGYLATLPYHNWEDADYIPALVTEILGKECRKGRRKFVDGKYEKVVA